MQHLTRTLRAVLYAALSITLWHLSTSPARAQAGDLAGGTGVLEGRVQDATSGANLRNARVQVGAAGVATTTDQSGFFRLTGLPPGEPYLAVATDDLEYAEQFDHEFLARMSKVASRFQLEESATRVLNLTLIQR